MTLPPTARRTRTRQRAAFLSWVLRLAVEGGVTYWATTANYVVESTDEGAELDDASVTLTDRESGAVFPVTVETVAGQLSQLGRVPRRDADGWTLRMVDASRANRAGDVSVDDADRLVQLAVFGRVRHVV
jgi:hypothetical protein